MVVIVVVPVVVAAVVCVSYSSEVLPWPIKELMPGSGNSLIHIYIYIYIYVHVPEDILASSF